MFATFDTVEPQKSAITMLSFKDMLQQLRQTTITQEKSHLTLFIKTVQLKRMVHMCAKAH